MLTNCINCGAPLKDNKCRYCGTVYKNDTAISAIFENNENQIGDLIIGDRLFKVRLKQIDFDMGCDDYYEWDMHNNNYSIRTRCSQRTFIFEEVKKC